MVCPGLLWSVMVHLLAHFGCVCVDFALNMSSSSSSSEKQKTNKTWHERPEEHGSEETQNGKVARDAKCEKLFDIVCALFSYKQQHAHAREVWQSIVVSVLGPVQNRRIIFDATHV